MHRHLLIALGMIAISHAVLPQADAQTGTITFVSDTSWRVDSAGTFLGFAQNVCLNASAPSRCPAGSTLYGFLGGGWTANLSSIPGATWIWAPRITGATSPAFPAEFFFSKTFNLLGVPTAGRVSVAVDDFAEVRVNGTSVGTTGSITNGSLARSAQSSLVTFDILSFLHPGTNVITIRAANGNFGCGSGPYSCNTAGVVFGTVGPVDVKETEGAEIATAFALLQAYPNPFNPETKINFQIPQTSYVELKVFDLLGREVATLVNERMNPGTYSASWDASGFASGVYLYRIKAGQFVVTKKLLLLR